MVCAWLCGYLLPGPRRQTSNDQHAMGQISKEYRHGYLMNCHLLRSHAVSSSGGLHFREQAQSSKMDMSGPVGRDRPQDKEKKGVNP